jgi:predicted nucleic acid-binding protein
VKVFVLDASLVVKWFVPEIHSEAARKWLDASHDYIAPDLLFPEAGNAMWKKVHRGELSADDAQALVNDLSAVA